MAENCAEAPPPLPELPPGFCLDTAEFTKWLNEAGSAWSDLEGWIAAGLAVPFVVLGASVVCWRLARWVFRGFSQAAN